MTKRELVQKLQEHLQTAVSLEMSTLPPYLCAYWSIYGESTHAVKVKQLILSVIREEMLHLAMAANLLNAMGGKPKLTGAHAVKYPSVLPGHSQTNHPFIVGLTGCTPEAISTFIEIEKPNNKEQQKKPKDGWCTIGEFYDEIEALLLHDKLTDKDFKKGDQIPTSYNPAPGKLYAVNDKDSALKALEEIIDQGEGHSGHMFDKDHQLTHYFKFKSVLDIMETGMWNYKEDVYPFTQQPDLSLFPPDAITLNDQFSSTYASMLMDLETACNGDHKALNRSIKLMEELEEPAVALMKIPLKDKKKGNCGPSF